MKPTKQILLGLGAGVATGIFLGELAAIWLKWAADGFVKLLQMTVLPYVTVSIISSLGSLRAAEARRLGVRAGAILIALWAVALSFAMLIPLTFPTIENAAFFSTTLLERRPPFNFVDLYIPANPFYSLANNVVPAVVLFAIILGVAVIGLERKPLLLDVLKVAGDALSRATRFIVRLTPFGLFAIAATAAGTLSVEQMGRLQIYLVAYVGTALLVSLWVLPGLVAALTPIRMRDIFALTRNALITAFVAGDLFIVLPVLIESSRTLVGRVSGGQDEVTTLPDVIVPASFNFPHTGKLLSISFILFAGWFADAVVPVAEYPRLALTGLVTFFGSLNIAVPFMLDLFRVPADTFQLFLASGVINSRFGTLAAAVHTVTVALLGTCAMTGLLQWNRRRLVRYAITTVALTVVLIGGTHLLFSRTLQQEYTKDKVLAGMHLLRDHGVVAAVQRSPGVAEDASGPLLDAIRRRGALRVGYLGGSLPFAFFNARQELVGFDVDLAYQLAAELGLRLEFVPVTRERLETQLADGSCDLVMSGVAVTTERASRLLFSNAYLDETMALVVRDELRDRFSEWSQLRSMPGLRLAVPDVPYYVQRIRERLPNAQLTLGADPAVLFEKGKAAEVDAILLPAERGSAWTLMYPEFSVVVPEPGVVKVPLAYPIAKHDQALASFLNTWIELKRKDGTIDVLYKYWILGQNATPQQPRWSVVRNVLHWVD